MWEWLMDELQKVAKALHSRKGLIVIDDDDIVQNVLLMLLDNRELAKNIYGYKNVGMLYTIVRREIYSNEAALCFENKMDLSRFQRIIAICEEYGIEPKSQNAYKISAILEDEHNNFSIATVTRLLSTYGNLAEKMYAHSISGSKEFHEQIKQWNFVDD